jgi:hypothetical protein
MVKIIPEQAVDAADAKGDGIKNCNTGVDCGKKGGNNLLKVWD